MIQLLTETPLPLGPGQLTELAGPYDYEITSLAGNLWITQAGKQDDIIVRAGETVVLDHPVPALLGGLGKGATVLISQRPPQAIAA